MLEADGTIPPSPLQPPAMKMNRLLTAILVSAALAVQAVAAINADELAQFLGVSSWQTAIDLPAGSYTVELYEFANGAVTERLMVSQPEWAERPDAGLTIIAGPREGNYRITIGCANRGTWGAVTKVPLFDTTMSNGLPPKIQDGDYVLFGKPLEGASGLSAQNLQGYARGFLLRIKKI